MTAILLRYIMVALTIALFFEPLDALAEQECNVPERFYTFEPSLTNVPKALESGRHIVIAVLGGASSLGVAAGGLELAWPARLGSVLNERFPSARIKIVNLAV